MSCGQRGELSTAEATATCSSPPLDDHRSRPSLFHSSTTRCCREPSHCRSSTTTRQVRSYHTHFHISSTQLPLLHVTNCAVPTHLWRRTLGKRKTHNMAPQYELHPDRKYSIAVVGGGIGGLCTAIGLLHQGVPVEIYEGRR